MQIWPLPSISLEQSNAIVGVAERVLLEEFPEIETVISRTGRAEIATDPMGVEISDTYLMLALRDSWRFGSKDELIEAIDEAMRKHVAGAIFSYSQPIELRVSELISGVRSEVAVHLYSDDLTTLEQKADEVAHILLPTDGPRHQRRRRGPATAGYRRDRRSPHFDASDAPGASGDLRRRGWR